MFGVFLITMVGLTVGGNTYEKWHPSHKVSIVWWEPSGGSKRVGDWAIPIFEREYPNIEVKYQKFPSKEYVTKILVSIASGVGPNVCWVNNQPYAPLAEAGVLRPVPSYVVDDKYVEENYLPGSEIKAWGKRYLLPTGVMCPILYYNVDMLNEAGISVQNIGRTWEEVAKTAQRLTVRENGKISRAGLTIHGGNNGVGEYLGYLWLDLMYQQEVGIISEDGKRAEFNTPEGVNAWKIILKFYEEYKTTSVNIPDFREAMGQGRAAMAPIWSWLGGYLKYAYPKAKVEATIYPTIDGDGPYARCNMIDTAYVVTTQGKGDEVKAAWELWKFLCLRDDILEWICKNNTIVPVKKSLLDAPWIREDSGLCAIKRQIEDPAGGVIYPGAFPFALCDALTSMAEAIIFKREDIEETLTKYEKDISKELQKHNYPFTPQA